MLYYLILITSILANPSCLAMDPSSTQDINYSSTYAINPRSRWVELHKQLYDDFPTPALNLSQTKSILEEMSSIEKSEVYKTDIEPFIESKGFRIKKYKQLVDKLYEADLLDKRDSTITDILLIIIEHDFNDCTANHFNLINNIYETLEYSPIAGALQENRNEQYANCWQRLMDIITTSSLILGSSSRNSLNSLTTLIYPPYQYGIVNFNNNNITSLRSYKYRDEFAYISGTIAQFLSLRARENDASDYEREFRRLIEQPCKTLVDATIHIASHIYAILKFIEKDNSLNLVTNEQILILNRYSLCYRIINDLKNIRTKVIENINNIELNYNIFESASTQPITTTDAQTSEYDMNLITQIEPFDQDLFREPVKRRRKNVPEKSIRSQPSRADYDENSGKIVYKIFGGFGSGRGARYPTYWSDKSITMEHEEYLKKHWPTAWNNKTEDPKAVHEAQRKTRLNKRLFSEISQNDEELDNNHDNDDEELDLDKIRLHSDKSLKVVEVRPGIGRGIYSLYPAIWSDGSASMETKEYLQTHWNDQWMTQVRKMRMARKRRYVAKKLS